MANIKSQIKRIKTNEKRYQRNKSVRSALKTQIKKATEALLSNNKEEAKSNVKSAIKLIDQAVSKGIIYKNTAARKKSSLVLKLNELLKKPEKQIEDKTKPVKPSKTVKKKVETKPATAKVKAKIKEKVSKSTTKKPTKSKPKQTKKTKE